jgi:hypothetical protein
MRASPASALWAAIAAGIGLAGVAAAQSFDFRDRSFRIESAFDYRGEDLVENTVNHPEPDTTTVLLEAVAGKLVWLGEDVDCRLSLVYVPGRANSGKVGCEPKRSGTASNWKEFSIAATFQTSASTAGDVLTLRGQMKGTASYRANYCGKSSSTARQFVITQTLRIRITGDTCEILELNATEVDDLTGTIDDQPAHQKSWIKWNANSGASCIMERRSDPNHKTQPPLYVPDIQC